MSRAITGVVSVLAALVLLPGCGKEEDAAKPTGTPAAVTQPAQPHPQPASGYVVVDTSGINKAEGGKTVAEVYSQKDQLAGQQVVVRGKVVKVAANIMNKNWVHVRDGTGEAGEVDLTVTTTDPAPAVGQTVVVSGVLSRKKDLGLGYQYDVLIENAKVKVEQ